MVSLTLVYLFNRRLAFLLPVPMNMWMLYRKQYYLNFLATSTVYRILMQMAVDPLVATNPWLISLSPGPDVGVVCVQLSCIWLCKTAFVDPKKAEIMLEIWWWSVQDFRIFWICILKWTFKADHLKHWSES